MVYFLKQKSDTTVATERFLADTAPCGSIKRIRSDNGTEFTCKEFRSLLIRNQIKHETSAPYSLHQNRTVERGWRSLFEMARCMLLEAQLAKELWAYAVIASAYIRNRCYNPRTGKAPYEAMTGRKPHLSKMHIFGTTCYAYVQNTKKLDARSEKGVFVGYDKGSPAYLVYFPESRAVKRGEKCETKLGDDKENRRLNAVFQRRARQDKEQSIKVKCRQIEESNKMGRTRDLYREIKDMTGSYSPR